MEINLIREKLTEIICSDELFDNWVNILQHTNPGNYGVEDIRINVDYRNIWVNIQERTFTFKNAEILFSARLGGSNEKNGYDANFNKEISGQGQFEFVKNSDDLIITEIEINEPLDLY
jgi:hypothetical protein